MFLAVPLLSCFGFTSPGACRPFCPPHPCSASVIPVVLLIIAPISLVALQSSPSVPHFVVVVSTLSLCVCVVFSALVLPSCSVTFPDSTHSYSLDSLGLGLDLEIRYASCLSGLFLGLALRTGYEPSFSSSFILLVFGRPWFCFLSLFIPLSVYHSS